jgi:hypothetical protein
MFFRHGIEILDNKTARPMKINVNTGILNRIAIVDDRTF